jgi:hypothetical protein
MSSRTTQRALGESVSRGCSGCCAINPRGVRIVEYKVQVFAGRSEKVIASWCSRCIKIAVANGTGVRYE